MGKLIQFKKPIPEHQLEKINYSVQGSDEVLDIECSTLTVVMVMDMCLQALQSTEMSGEEMSIIRRKLKRLELSVHAATLNMDCWVPGTWTIKP